MKRNYDKKTFLDLIFGFYTIDYNMVSWQAVYGRTPPTIPSYTRGTTTIQAVEDDLLTRDQMSQAAETKSPKSTTSIAVSTVSKAQTVGPIEMDPKEVHEGISNWERDANQQKELNQAQVDGEEDENIAAANGEARNIKEHVKPNWLRDYVMRMGCYE
uniref:Uncharacterized protein n=1 Tax=Cannabis sativa TaxID=3483 RepID=A0A803Q1F9_CANSA